MKQGNDSFKITYKTFFSQLINTKNIDTQSESMQLFKERFTYNKQCNVR